MNDHNITFGRPDISLSEIEAVADVLRSGWLSTGEISRKFEKEFEEYVSSGQTAVAVNSCTMGLFLSLKAVGVSHGDEVVLPVLTFCATLNAVLATGGKPIFVDVKKDGQINEKQFDESITSKTKAVIPVDYTGTSCDMLLLKNIAKKHNVKVIEDAAHGFGGRYSMLDIKLGTLADFASFSFYPTKNITSGEGGMVLIKDPEMVRKIRCLSMNGVDVDAWDRMENGVVRKYEVLYPGFKGNMPDILAAIGLIQLRRWDETFEQRKKIWNVYQEWFGKRPGGHSTHLFTLLVKNRDEVRNAMREVGIGTGIHFRPLHLEPAYKFLGYLEGSFPNAEFIGRYTMSLPISTTMTDDDVAHVVESIKDLKVEIVND